MGRYNFVSPGAAAGDAIAQQIMQREMIKRQMMLDEERRRSQEEERVSRTADRARQDKDFELRTRQYETTAARQAEQDRVAAEDRARANARLTDVRGVRSMMGSVYGGGPMDEDRARSISSMALTEDVELPGIIEKGIERVIDPEMYQVTTTGPGGGPLNKTVTEAEMRAGVPGYRAPVQGPQPNYVTLVSPQGEEKQVTEGPAANALMAQQWKRAGTGAAGGATGKMDPATAVEMMDAARHAANDLIDHEGFNGLFGAIQGQIPTGIQGVLRPFGGGQAVVNAEGLLTQVQRVLQLANTPAMTGTLSNSDMQILLEAGTTLKRPMDEETAQRELERIITTLDRAISRLGGQASPLPERKRRMLQQPQEGPVVPNRSRGTASPTINYDAILNEALGGQR